MIKGRKSKLGYGIMDVNYLADGIDTPIPVKSVVLGDGGMKVLVGYNIKNNIAGVAFSYDENDKTAIGENIPSEKKPYNVSRPEVEIMFDNPVSIDVVVNLLLEAKERLLNEDWSAACDSE